MQHATGENNGVLLQDKDNQVKKLAKPYSRLKVLLPGQHHLTAYDADCFP